MHMLYKNGDSLSHNFSFHQVLMYIFNYNTIHMHSGITSGRVLDGELLYTKILEVNLFALFCKQINF